MRRAVSCSWTAIISRLVQKGYKVAIAEQMEDPKLAKGLVKREVIQSRHTGNPVVTARPWMKQRITI